MSNQLKMLYNDLAGNLLDLDPIKFVERNLTVKGQLFKLTDCGRDYLHEIYRYIAFEATTPQALPVIIVKGRQVEMSTTATALTLYFMCSPRMQHITGLHAFPQLKQAQRYSNKAFDSMVQDSVDQSIYLKTRSKQKDKDGYKIQATYSVSQKDFIQGNTLYIEGASQEGDRLRNISLDFIMYDEIQDWTQEARDVVQEANSHSRLGPPGFGMEVMLGTPKDKKDDYYDLWKESDQRYYHLKCIYCGHFFPITLNNFETGFMVRCRDREGKGCLELQDKRKAIKGGKWIPSKTVGFNRRGYHVDQLLIPTITREAIDKKREDKSPRAFANEVMGQFYSGMSEALSYKEVVQVTSKQPDSKNWSMPPYVTDKFTWMGIDWGARVAGEDDAGRGGYTVVTILSRHDNEKWKLEFAHRMETDNIDKQIEIINDYIRKYHVQYICADIGFGHAQVQRLQQQWGERCLSVFSSQNMKKAYNYNSDTNMITIDKSVVMEEFFDYLMQYRFCFPYKEPDRIEWLAEHISNIEIVSKQVGGMVRKRYVKQSATRPVDGLMSLIYGFVAYQYSRTNKFSNMSARDQGDGRNMAKPQLANVSKSVAGVMRGGYRKTRHHKH